MKKRIGCSIEHPLPLKQAHNYYKELWLYNQSCYTISYVQILWTTCKTLPEVIALWALSTKWLLCLCPDNIMLLFCCILECSWHPPLVAPLKWLRSWFCWIFVANLLIVLSNLFLGFHKHRILFLEISFLLSLRISQNKSCWYECSSWTLY